MQGLGGGDDESGGGGDGRGPSSASGGLGGNAPPANPGEPGTAGEGIGAAAAAGSESDDGSVDGGGGNGASASIFVSDDEFQRAAGPLALHFFPDGPPPQASSRREEERELEEASASSSSPQPSSWWPLLVPQAGGGAGRNRGAARRRAAVVPAEVAARSLQRTLALCAAPPGGAPRATNPRRRVLTGSQAGALVWIAAEMMARRSGMAAAAARERGATAAISSPLAAPENACDLLRSIRVAAAAGTTRGQKPPPEGAAIPRPALLRLASLLAAAAAPRRGAGSEGPAAEAARSAAARLLHLLVTAAAAAAHGPNDAPGRSSLAPAVAAAAAGCCVHARTPPGLRADACRLFVRCLRDSNGRRPDGDNEPPRRALALRFRVRLEALLDEAKAAGSSARNPRREDRPLRRWRLPLSKAPGAAPAAPAPASEGKRRERSALAAVLREMAAADPGCRDLVLVLPDDDDGEIGGGDGWRAFPEPEWEHDFFLAAGCFPEEGDAAFGRGPGDSPLLHRGREDAESSKRPRYNERSNRTSWLARWRSGDGLLGGVDASLSSSVDAWTVANGSRSTRSQVPRSAKIVEALQSRDLHHRMILNQPSTESFTEGYDPRTRDGEVGLPAGPDVSDDRSDAELKRIQILMPFLLSDYATFVNSPSATDATAASVSATRMEPLLSGLHSLTLRADELIPAVRGFVESRLLPNWDGRDSALLALVSYWPPCPFEELHRRVLGRYLEPMLVHGDARLQYRIVARTLAPLVERWGRKIVGPRLDDEDEGAPLAASLERMQVDEHQASEPAASRCDLVRSRAICQLVRWVDGVLVKLFVASNDDSHLHVSNEDLLQLAALEFFASVVHAMRRNPSCFRDLAGVPSPQIMYRLLLTTSPFITERLCQLLHLYQHERRDVIGSPEDGSMEVEIACEPNGGMEPTRANEMQELIYCYNYYVQDACGALSPTGPSCSDDEASWSLVSSRSFADCVVADPGTLAQMQQLINNSRLLGATTNSFDLALSLAHGPVFGGFARDFARHSSSGGADGERDAMKTASDDDDEAEHEGIIRRGDASRRYLDYLRERGFLGIHNLLSSYAPMTRGEIEQGR